MAIKADVALITGSRKTVRKRSKSGSFAVISGDLGLRI